MASFPTSWIIEPLESGGGEGNGVTPPAQLARRPIKRPTTPPPHLDPRLHSRCSPPGFGMPCNHDDVHPTHPLFEFVQGTHCDGFPFKLHGLRAHARHSFENHTHQSRTPTTHPLSQASVVSMTPCPPQQNPSSRYSSHFPSSWLLSPQNVACCTISPSHSPASPTPRAETRLASASTPTALFPFAFRADLPVRTAVHLIAEDVRAETQASFVTETDSSITTDQLLAELKGEPTHPDKEEEIGIWVQSLGPTSRARAPGGVRLSVDAGLRVVGEKHPSSFQDDFADACGLGDAPHVTQDVYDTYSIYSTSTVQDR